MTLSVPIGPQASKNEIDLQLDKLSCRLDASDYHSQSAGPAEEIERQRIELRARAQLLERQRFSDSRWRSLSEPVAFDLKGVNTPSCAESGRTLALLLLGSARFVTGVCCHIHTHRCAATRPYQSRVRLRTGPRGLS